MSALASESTASSGEGEDGVEHTGERGEGREEGGGDGTNTSIYYMVLHKWNNVVDTVSQFNPCMYIHVITQKFRK